MANLTTLYLGASFTKDGAPDKSWAINIQVPNEQVEFALPDDLRLEFYERNGQIGFEILGPLGVKLYDHAVDIAFDDKISHSFDGYAGAIEVRGS